MKRLLFLILFATSALSISAQKSGIDERLLVKFSAEEMKKLQIEDPEELKYLTYCIENAFSIGKTSKEKIKSQPDNYGAIKLKSLPINNFFELNLNINNRTAQYFLINGTEKVLVVKSKYRILKELKK